MTSLSLQYGRFHYSSFANIQTPKKEKDAALKRVCGKFDLKMSLYTEGIDCVKWWITNVRFAEKPIIRKPSDIVIESYSSLTVWSAINNSNLSTVSGIRSKADLSHHINYLET